MSKRAKAGLILEIVITFLTLRKSRLIGCNQFAESSGLGDSCLLCADHWLLQFEISIMLL